MTKIHDLPDKSKFVAIQSKASETVEKGRSLDTLAQLVTNEYEPLDFDCCTSLSDKANLLKRARRKYFTNQILWKLIDAAKENKNSELGKSYWNTYHCSRNLFVNDNRTITGKYCNTRWCMVCNAIRTAKHINKYNPIVKEWDNPYFVTLTSETVDADRLKERIELMQKVFVRIRNLYNQNKHRSNVDFELKGIRKLECTHNALSDKYHPHYHVICNCQSSAEFLISNWLRCFTKEGVKVSHQAQDMRLADSNSLIELFKYMTKVVTRKGGGKRVIDAKALDIIFNAMKGKKTVQPFGFRVAKQNASNQVNPTVGLIIGILTWSDEYADWLDSDGYMLTNYVPSAEFMKLLDG